MADGWFPDLEWHHTGFSVADIDVAIDFYTEVFGMELEFRKYIEPIDTHLCFLRRGNFRFEIFQKAGSTPVPEHRLKPNSDLGEQGTKHPCFSVVDCQAALERLSDHKDVKIVGVIRKPGDPMLIEDNPKLGADDPRMPAAAFFFRDPSDIIVEVVAASSFAD
ncbi:MAG: lactoylglutathione lyase [Rhodobacteraceae bacterium]|nr:MAG: lactoylglutathione lyase [Paracoccaceae bacterium]